MMSQWSYHMLCVKDVQLDREKGYASTSLLFFLAVEHYRPRNVGSSLSGEEPVTSLRQLWGLREREIEPKAMFQNVEKAKMADERKQSPAGSSLFESRGPPVSIS